MEYNRGIRPQSRKNIFLGCWHSGAKYNLSCATVGNKHSSSAISSSSSSSRCRQRALPHGQGGSRLLVTSPGTVHKKAVLVHDSPCFSRSVAKRFLQRDPTCSQPHELDDCKQAVLPLSPVLLLICLVRSTVTTTSCGGGYPVKQTPSV